MSYVIDLWKYIFIYALPFRQGHVEPDSIMEAPHSSPTSPEVMVGRGCIQDISQRVDHHSVAKSSIILMGVMLPLLCT